MRRGCTWLRLAVGLALMAGLAACRSGVAAPDPGAQAAARTPAEVVQAAAHAFAAAYNEDEPLAQFDALFATSGHGGDAAGLMQTQAAAQTLFDQRAADAQFQLRSFTVTSQQVDQQHGLATVQYRAEISIVANGVAVEAALVVQDVALVRRDGSWLIAGGDQPQVIRQRL
jgi:hypothetical protein